MNKTVVEPDQKARVLYQFTREEAVLALREVKMGLLHKDFPSTTENVVVNIRAGCPKDWTDGEIRVFIKSLVSSRINRLHLHSYPCIQPILRLVWVCQDQEDASRDAWESIKEKERYGFELEVMKRHPGFGGDFQQIEDYGRGYIGKEKGTILITDADSQNSSCPIDGYALPYESHAARIRNLVRAMSQFKVDLMGVQQQNGMNRVFAGGPAQMNPEEHNRGGLKIWKGLTNFSYNSIRNFFLISSRAPGGWSANDDHQYLEEAYRQASVLDLGGTCGMGTHLYTRYVAENTDRYSMNNPDYRRAWEDLRDRYPIVAEILRKNNKKVSSDRRRHHG